MTVFGTVAQALLRLHIVVLIAEHAKPSLPAQPPCSRQLPLQENGICQMCWKKGTCRVAPYVLSHVLTSALQAGRQAHSKRRHACIHVLP